MRGDWGLLLSVVVLAVGSNASEPSSADSAAYGPGSSGGWSSVDAQVGSALTETDQTNAKNIPDPASAQAPSHAGPPQTNRRGGKPSSGDGSKTDNHAQTNAQSTCNMLCPLYASRVASVDALDTLAENFFILWNKVVRDFPFKDKERLARATVPRVEDSDGAMPPSLEQIVSQWAEQRFGPDATLPLAFASGISIGKLPPVFRSFSHEKAATVDASCPMGNLGSLGHSSCPKCSAGKGPIPASLLPCLAAYAHSGDILQGQPMSSGRYQQALQGNFCAAQDLFSAVEKWSEAVPPDVRNDASASLATVLMFQTALDGDMLVVSKDDPPPRRQVFQFWQSYFASPLDNAPPSTLSDLNSCGD